MDLYNRMSLSKVRNKGMLRLIEIPNPSNCLLCEARLLVWNTPGTQSSSLKPKLAQLFLLELFFFGDVWWWVQLHYITFLMWFLPGGKWVSPMIPPWFSQEYSLDDGANFTPCAESSAGLVLSLGYTGSCLGLYCTSKGQKTQDFASYAWVKHMASIRWARHCLQNVWKKGGSVWGHTSMLNVHC